MMIVMMIWMQRISLLGSALHVSCASRYFKFVPCKTIKMFYIHCIWWGGKYFGRISGEFTEVKDFLVDWYLDFTLGNYVILDTVKS